MKISKKIVAVLIFFLIDKSFVRNPRFNIYHCFFRDTAGYLLPVVWAAFFHNPEPGQAEGVKDPLKGDANLNMRLALIATSVLTVIFGLVPQVLNLQVGLARQVAQMILGGTP